MTAVGDSKLAAAAKKIRDTAQGCPPWPWVLNAEGDEVVAADGIPVTEAFALSSNQQRTTARHIRLWDPGVAEFVADLLSAIDRLEQPNRIDVINTGVAALGLAKRLLGEDALSVDEQVELASKAVGEAAAALGDRFAGVEAFDASSWPGSGPSTVSVTYVAYAPQLEEGRKQARIQGLPPAAAEVYAQGWVAAMARADRAIEDAQRAADKSLWDANFNAELVFKRRIEDLERQLRCVKLYGNGFLLDHGGEQVALDPTKVTMVLPADLPTTEMELRSRVAQMLGQIERVRRIADEIECTNCDHPAKLHIDGHCTAPRQDSVFPRCRCSWGRGNLAEAIDEALGEEQADG